MEPNSPPTVTNSFRAAGPGDRDLRQVRSCEISWGLSTASPLFRVALTVGGVHMVLQRTELKESTAKSEPTAPAPAKRTTVLEDDDNDDASTVDEKEEAAPVQASNAAESSAKSALSGGAEPSSGAAMDKEEEHVRENQAAVAVAKKHALPEANAETLAYGSTKKGLPSACLYRLPGQQQVHPLPVCYPR